MGGTLLAIVLAGTLAVGQAFRPFHHLPGPRNCAGSVLRPCDRHRRRAPGSPLFGAEAEGYNRDYLTRTLGVSDKKIERIVESGWNILTLEIGVLEERVGWLSARIPFRSVEIRILSEL